MTETKTEQAPKTPEGLGRRGAAFWEAVVTEYRPHIDDSELLLEVCRTLDLVELLQGQLSRKGGRD